MITDIEKRILLSLHLKGTMGKCGNINEKDRLNLLTGLINKGLLTNDLNLTEKGKQLSK